MPRGGPGRLIFVVNNAVGGVVRFWTGLARAVPARVRPEDASGVPQGVLWGSIPGSFGGCGLKNLCKMHFRKKWREYHDENMQNHPQERGSSGGNIENFVFWFRNHTYSAPANVKSVRGVRIRALRAPPGDDV